MGLITKNDLIYKDYSWTAISGDNPKVTDEPDSTLFNRHEGYEVLYLINKLAEMWNFKQKISAEKMEKMIRKYLPSDIRSQINVKQWIQNNWEKY